MDVDFEKVKNQVESKIKFQNQWKQETIEIAIKALCAVTRKERDYILKDLLNQLIRMPQVTEYDLGKEPDECPF